MSGAMVATGAAVGRRRHGWVEWVAHALPYLLFAAAMLLLDSIGRGATQEEFFRSVQQSVGNGPGGGNGQITARGFATFLGVVGLIVALIVLAQRVHKWLGRREPARRPSKPENINQPRKLMKEVARAAGLSSDEMRQLKAAAEARGHASPLTLLLCPSLLIDAAQKGEGPADKAVLARVARKVVSR